MSHIKRKFQNLGGVARVLNMDKTQKISCLTVDFAFNAVGNFYTFGTRHGSSLIADPFQCNTTHRQNYPSGKMVQFGILRILNLCEKAF